MTHIDFADFFRMPEEALEWYRAFNVSLISDLPLFAGISGSSWKRETVSSRAVAAKAS